MPYPISLWAFGLAWAQAYQQHSTKNTVPNVAPSQKHKYKLCDYLVLQATYFIISPQRLLRGLHCERP